METQKCTVCGNNKFKRGKITGMKIDYSEETK